MLTTPLKMVVIVAEPVLESRLVTDLRQMGARGFTVVEGRGEGTKQVHATEEGENVRIETIVTSAVADRILEHVSATYFDNYSVIAYVTDVAVARGGKYT